MSRKRAYAVTGSMTVYLLVTGGLVTAESIDSVVRPDTSRKNGSYVGNREPLLDVGLDEDAAESDAGAEFGGDQQVVFADDAQAGQVGGILEEGAAILDLVG